MKGQLYPVSDVGVKVNFLIIKWQVVVNRFVEPGGHFSKEAAHVRSVSAAFEEQAFKF